MGVEINATGDFKLNDNPNWYKEELWQAALKYFEFSQTSIPTHIDTKRYNCSYIVY